MPFPPSQFASSQRKTKTLERLNIFQTVRSCRQINVGSGGAAAGVIFFFVVTTLLGSAQSRYLSSPLLSSPPSPPLITPRFHFNDFLVALGGPVIRESPSKQSQLSTELMVLRGSLRGSGPHVQFCNVSAQIVVTDHALF